MYCLSAASGCQTKKLATSENSGSWGLLGRLKYCRAMQSSSAVYAPEGHCCLLDKPVHVEHCCYIAGRQYGWKLGGPVILFVALFEKRIMGRISLEYAGSDGGVDHGIVPEG